MNYIVAVDSGGTRTCVRILRPDGSYLDLPEMDTIIDPIGGTESMAKTFRSLFGEVEAHLGMSTRSIWISAAGYQAPEKKLIDDMLDEYLIFPGYVGIANDGVSLVLAHDQHTLIAIAGTGSTVMARSSENVISQLSGNGWVASDYGSGFWIGLEGIRAAYRAYEGGPGTSLEGRLINHYGRLGASLGRGDDLTIPTVARQLSHVGYGLKRQIASFAAVVCDVAQRSDAVAQVIVREAAEQLADLVARMYRQTVERTDDEQMIVPRIVLCGSVVSLSPFYRNAFESRLNLNLSDVLQDLRMPTVTIEVVFSGIDACIKLAQQLNERGGDSFPVLDPLHPIRIVKSVY